MIKLYQNAKGCRLRVHIITTGCSISRAIGEILKYRIDKSKNLELNSLDDADIVILNLCAVKKPTEDKEIELAKKIVRMGKRIIITGCLAESSHRRIRRQVPEASVVSVELLLGDNLDEILDAVYSGDTIYSIGHPLQLHYPVNTILDNPLIGTIPIAFGCTNSCSYCIDVKIWGRVKSLPLDEIISQAKKLIRKGVKEIRLTAHDTAAYGLDLGCTLVDLIEKILEIDGEFRLRIGMASPNTFEPISDALLDIILQDDRVYKFIHIPVQSGSNRILRLMNRPYTIEEYAELFNKVRKKLGSYSTIATDIISAFPTETEEDHKATMKMLEKLKPDIVNLSRYGDRPGTPSTKLRPKVNSKVAKRRTKELFELIKKISFARNQIFKGRTLEVLFLEKKGQYAGRAFNNRLVYVNEDVKLGEFYQVKIKNNTWKSLYGEIV